MTDNSRQMNQDRANLPERVELARRPAGQGIHDDVILVYLPHNRNTPFVTWREGHEPPHPTFWGHYHDSLRAALDDFETR